MATGANHNKILLKSAGFIIYFLLEILLQDTHQKKAILKLYKKKREISL